MSSPAPSDDLRDLIVQTANSPSSVSSDAGSVTGQSLSDLINADKHLANKDSAKRPARGLRITKLLPPGAV